MDVWTVIYRYCRDTGNRPPIDIMKFVDWCQLHHPEAVPRIEEWAANIFNKQQGPR